MADLQLNYRMQGQNMMAYYEQFFLNDPPLNILIYSGDVDIATVPHAKTQICLDGLGRSVTESWSRWTVQALLSLTGPTT